MAPFNPEAQTGNATKLAKIVPKEANKKDFNNGPHRCRHSRILTPSKRWGRGTRHSSHFAAFASNFLPPITDLLLWEFAINDYAYGDYMLKESHIEQERSMLIPWLR